MRHVLDTPVGTPIPDYDPDIDVADQAFLSADDVAAFAAAGGILTGQRRTHSWHLDRRGWFTCGTQATVCDSLESWAADPRRLIDAFVTGRPERTCSPMWVVIDERPTLRGPNGEPALCDPPGEQDVEQYLRLRRQLEVAGITLVDAVVFDDQRHWWSMCELLTGRSAWSLREPTRSSDSVSASGSPTLRP